MYTFWKLVSAGAVTQLGCCQTDGSLLFPSGDRRLCTACSATTFMPDHIWPPMLAEAVCVQGHMGCLHVQGEGGKKHEIYEIDINLSYATKVHVTNKRDFTSIKPHSNFIRKFYKNILHYLPLAKLYYESTNLYILGRQWTMP